MLSFGFVKVKHVGKRVQPMKVNIIVEGKRYSAGYVFGKNMIQTVLECEADILTGKTQPEINNETGSIKNGFVVVGDLGDMGLTGEAYEIVQPETQQQLDAQTYPGDVWNAPAPTSAQSSTKRKADAVSV